MVSILIQSSKVVIIIFNKTNSYCKPTITFYNSGTSNENDAGDKDAKLCKLNGLVR